MLVAIPASEAALIHRTVASISRPGATLDGQQRRTVALRSREFAASPRGAPPADLVGELVWRLTVAPHTVRPEWIEHLATAGIDAATYVEVLSIVARITAIDTFCFALGAPPATIPDPVAGAPTGEFAPDATIDGGWVPTVGIAWPPSALSLLPAEHEAMHDLHAVLYLSMDEMVDMDIDRGLHRTEMELIAARTSYLNECFY